MGMSDDEVPWWAERSGFFLCDVFFLCGVQLLHIVDSPLIVALFFCPKAILPPTSTSNPPPLPWCEPITHFNGGVFLVFLGLSDGFRWVLDFGRIT